MSLNYATGEVTYRLDGQVLPFTGTFNPANGLGYAPLYTFASANAGDVPRAIFDDYADCPGAHRGRLRRADRPPSEFGTVCKIETMPLFGV